MNKKSNGNNNGSKPPRDDGDNDKSAKIIKFPSPKQQNENKKKLISNFALGVLVGTVFCVAVFCAIIML